jgi:hypothetical protein
MSLLFHTMQGRPDWQSWPQEIRLELEKCSKSDIAQELLRAHHLCALLNAFSERGVPCLLMKGEALAYLLYPASYTRTRCDSDLFIPIEGIEGARQAVLDAGYSIVSPVLKSHQFTVRRTQEASDVLEFDVHWRILNAARYARVLSFEGAYRNSIDVPGFELARTLSHVDLLLHACVHRVASDWHDQDRLIWIYDIHLLVTAMTGEQLGAFADKAARLDVQRACLTGLELSMECFGTDLPEKVIQKLQLPELPETLSKRYQYSNLGLLVDDWKHLPDSRARMNLLGELFFPASDSLMTRYKKNNRGWLPVLYVRQVVGSLVQRLLLR